jgi:hypothetical protein
MFSPARRSGGDVSLRIVTEPTETLELFADGCVWATHISLCLARVDTKQGGTAAWRAIAPHLGKITTAIVNLDGNAAEPVFLRQLDSRGVLRIAPGDPVVMNVNLYGFWREEEGRVLLGSAALTETTLERAVSAMIYALGPLSDEFFCGVRRLIERCGSIARLPRLDELRDYERNWSSATTVAPAPTSLANFSVNGSLDLVTVDNEIGLLFQRLALSLGIKAAGEERVWCGSVGAWVRMSQKNAQFVLDVALQAESEPDLTLELSKSSSSVRSSGAFARDESGAVYLVHRGLGRAHSATSQELFWSTTRCRSVELRQGSDVGNGAQVALICKLDTPEAPAHLRAFVGEVMRLRGMGEFEPEDRRDATQFLDDYEDTQVDRVWEILLGRGSIERDEAVRLVARELRDEGEASFKRLDSWGPLYQGIDAAIDRGFDDKDFDRPRKGQVRAVQRDLDAEQWRNCLLHVLTEEPVEQEAVFRDAADHAAEAFGVRYTRWRSGSRIDRALRSAVNSGVRRGLIVRTGRTMIARARIER